jgi:4-amino-4-deoxy-L-arabinose transferase-like glycosyltransferase
MPPTTRTKNRLILFLLWVVFYCSFTLFTPPLLDDADSVHAEVAREMLVRHDLVTLYANGIRYLEKAPLYYWSIAASFKLFGISTAASRIPLALGVLLLALTLESFARRAFCSDRAGLYAGLITLSSFGIFIFSRINIPDVLVCCWLTLALFAFWRTEAGPQPSRHLCWLFAAACALNLLTKGLIGIVFPVGIVLITLLATRGLTSSWQRITQFHPLSSTAVFLAIGVPWHLLAAAANPTQGHPGNLTFSGGHFSVPLPTDGNVHGWAWFYFVNEQVLRYLNLRVPRDYDTDPLWLFLGLILVWLMPWSAWLPQAFARALPLRSAPFRQRLVSHTLTPAERTNLFLILWTLLPLAFFSLSTRQEYYVLPSLPPVILLISRVLATNLGAPGLASEAWVGPAKLRVPHPSQSHRDGWAAAKPTALFLLLCGLAAAAISLYFLLHSQPPAPNTDLSTLLTQNPADYALSFGHFLDLNARALGMFRICFYLILISVTGGTLAHFLLVRRARAHTATLTLAAASFVFLYAAWTALRIFAPTLTSEQLARAIAPQLKPTDLLAIHGEYEAGSTLGFYLRRNDLHIVEGRSSNLWYGSFFPDAPKIFETRDSIAARWQGPQRIFLWQDTNDHDRPPLALPAPVYVIADSGGKQILSNQP